MDDARKFAATHTPDDRSWRASLSLRQQGWGIHRLTRFMDITDCTPAVAALDVPQETDLSFSFEHEVDFQHTSGKNLRLYAVGSPGHVVWQSDPEPGHPATGARTVTFRDLPRLEPNRGYYLVADDGWIRVAGRPIPGFNDGSLADRFRTAPQDIAVPTASAPAHPLPQE